MMGSGGGGGEHRADREADVVPHRRSLPRDIEGPSGKQQERRYFKELRRSGNG
jgi:hypothetical protein